MRCSISAPKPLNAEQIAEALGIARSSVSNSLKEREIDPATQTLRACVAQAETESWLDPIALQWMQDMQDFLATADTWFRDMLTVPRPKLVMLMKMGTKVVSLLNFTGGKKSG
ncbi:hypothetical protein [Ruegeria arenilitoris]|uniref:hypothetical protein n=1 Tax=Ruegeria arenilitoris TaxID=1173585 RepID=UPI001C2BEFD9|nr:hypothetical protein [Ruegeria arenilitoris]